MKNPEQIIRRCREGIRIFEEVIAALESPDTASVPKVRASEYRIKTAFNKLFRKPLVHEAPNVVTLTAAKVKDRLQVAIRDELVSTFRVGETLKMMGYKTEKVGGMRVFKLIAL